MPTYAGFKTIEAKEFYERNLLQNLKENNIMLQFGTKTTLPKNHGDVVSWRKRLPIEVQKDSDGNVRTLIEGVTPTSNKMEFVDYKVTIKEYGDWIRLTNKLTNLAFDPILKEATDGLGESAADTFDELILETLYKNPNIAYAGNTTSSTITSSNTLKLTDLHRIKANFQKRNVKPYADGKYILLIDPDVEFDFKQDETGKSNWIDINQYSGKDQILKGEIGSIFGFKVVVTNKIKVGKSGSGNDVDVHKCIAFGKNPYGIVELEGNSASSPKVWYNAPGTQGNDPLKQRHSVAWKTEGFAVRVLYPEAVTIIMAPSSLDYAGDIDEATNPLKVNVVSGTANKYQTFDTNKGIVGSTTDTDAEIAE